VWLALIALAAVVGVVTGAAVVWVVLVMLVATFGAAGVSGDRVGLSVNRKAEIARQAFPARKRFEDAPAEYDEAAWEREKARRAADHRD
jgi:hypothetical protein